MSELVHNNFVVGALSGASWVALINGSTYWNMNNSGGNLTFVAGGGAIVLTLGSASNATTSFKNTLDDGSGNMIQPSAAATSATTTVNSPTLTKLGSYWNGTAAVSYGGRIYWSQDSTTPTGHFSFNLNNAGTITEVAKLDQSGNLTTSGWAYVKGKNRTYQQNLTAATTTSTSAVIVNTSNAITPAFSGYLVVNAVLISNNNTLADGVTVSLYQGASSGALTTLLCSDTYTQEGLASNDHTFVLHYELSSQTVGTATYLSVAQNAVTGGTASTKIMSFSVQEV